MTRIIPNNTCSRTLERLALAGAILIALWLVAPPTAGAQPEEPARPAAADGQAPPPYKSPLRSQCEAEMAKDPVWSGTLRAAIRRENDDAWQTANAARLAKDNSHVVWAYAIIWVILLAFVVAVFLRQARLVREIEQLRADVDRAAAE